jgi:signal transduction histidine kinase
MRWWHFSAAMNTVVLVAYLAISFHILRGVVRSGRITSNPLALATGLIFLTCAIHHGSHPVHMFLPTIGIGEHSHSMREAFDSWHTSAFDLVTAGVAVWYWRLRNRFPALVRGSALFEDLRERERQALEINDNVVQHLAVAKLAYDLGKHDEAYEAIDVGLTSSRRIITELLGDETSTGKVEPGRLRRQAPGGQ